MVKTLLRKGLRHHALRTSKVTEDDGPQPVPVTVHVAPDVMAIIEPWIKEENGTVESFISGVLIGYAAQRQAEEG